MTLLPGGALVEPGSAPAAGRGFLRRPRRQALRFDGLGPVPLNKPSANQANILHSFWPDCAEGLHQPLPGRRSSFVTCRITPFNRVARGKVRILGSPVGGWGLNTCPARSGRSWIKVTKLVKKRCSASRSIRDGWKAPSWGAQSLGVRDRITGRPAERGPHQSSSVLMTVITGSPPSPGWHWAHRSRHVPPSSATLK